MGNVALDSYLLTSLFPVRKAVTIVAVFRQEGIVVEVGFHDADPDVEALSQGGCHGGNEEDVI